MAQLERLTPLAGATSKGFFEEITKQEAALTDLNRKLHEAQVEGQKIKAQAYDTLCFEESQVVDEVRDDSDDDLDDEPPEHWKRTWRRDRAPTIQQLHELLDNAQTRRRRRSKSCAAVVSDDLHQRLKEKDDEINSLRREVAQLRAALLQTPRLSPRRERKIIEFEPVERRTSTLDDDDDDDDDAVIRASDHCHCDIADDTNATPIQPHGRRRSFDAGFMFCGPGATPPTTSPTSAPSPPTSGFYLLDWLFTTTPEDHQQNQAKSPASPSPPVAGGTSFFSSSCSSSSASSVLL